MSSTSQPFKSERYEDLKSIGSGGYADVFSARDTVLNRVVALKVLKARWALDDPVFLQNFQQEAKSAAALRHNNIITIYDQGEAGGRFYIAMDYISGGSLEQRLKNGRLTPEQTADFIHQLASALDYAHGKNMIHRDVKPSNVLVRSDQKGKETVILADFGIARAYQEGSARQSTTAVGTGPYMASEQFTQPGKIDYRVDVYALGVVAYQLLTGVLPFNPEGKSLALLMQEILTVSPPPLADKDIHPRIERVVLKALSKAPDDRFGSAGAFAEALGEAVISWKKETGERDTLTMFAGMAVQATAKHDWPAAAVAWRKYLALAPNDELAQTQLSTAEREIKLAELRAAANECENHKDWDGVVASLQALLAITPNDQVARQQLNQAQMQQELRTLYVQAETAFNRDDLDEAIRFSQQIIGRQRDYPNAAVLHSEATRRKVEKLKSAALLAVAHGAARQALDLAGQIRQTDPKSAYCPRQELDEIISLATEKLAAEKVRRQRLIFGAVGGVVLLICVIGALVVSALNGLPLAPGPTVVAHQTPAALKTDEARAETSPASDVGRGAQTATVPSVIPSNTPSQPPTRPPTATTMPTTLPTNTLEPSPIPSLTPVSIATVPPGTDAVVLAGGAELRPGASTWWRPRQTLSAGTLLSLIGYDPDFPDWVYVRTVVGETGWVERAKLNLQQVVTNLPRVTPLPTLTTTPAVRTIPANCPGGTLWLDAWDVGKACTDRGWKASIFVEGHGGSCSYTYAWEGQVKGGPMAGSLTFDVENKGHGIAIVGKVSVTSGGVTLSQGLHIPPIACP